MIDEKRQEETAVGRALKKALEKSEHIIPNTKTEPVRIAMTEKRVVEVVDFYKTKK